MKPNPLILGAFAVAALQVANAFWQSSSDGPRTEDSTRAIEGTLGASYRVPRELTAIERQGHDQYVEVAPEYRADVVVAVPIRNGSVTRAALDETVTAPIDTQGAFRLNLKALAGTDYVVMLVNTAATTKSDRVVGFVTIPDRGSSLLRIPLWAARKDLVLGTLEAVRDEARSGQDLQALHRSFTLSTAELRQIAEADDVLRNVKNFYINSDDTRWFESEPAFGFRAPSASIKNTWGRPEAFASQSSFLRVTTNSGAPLALYSPQARRSQTGLDIERDHSGDTRYAFAMSPKVPKGLWTLKWGRKEIAQVDMEAASPLGEREQPLTYVPSVRVNVDRADTVKSIEVRWYYWDTVGTRYVEVKDLSLLRDSIADVSVDVKTSTGGGREAIAENHVGALRGISALEKPWKYFGNGSATEPVVNDIAVSYALGGVRLAFAWEASSP